MKQKGMERKIIVRKLQANRIVILSEVYLGASKVNAYKDNSKYHFKKVIESALRLYYLPVKYKALYEITRPAKLLCS
jgi:hypothetical protein